MRISRARLTPIVAAGAVLAAALAGVGLPTAPATAAAGCRIDYVPNQWTGGFTANIRISPGDTAVNGWTVTWTWGGDQRITNGWSAEVSQSGATVTARNVAWNASVPAGGSTEFGVQGTVGANTAGPTGFALNGVPCNGATPPRTTTAPPSTPPPTTPPPTTPPPTTPPPTTPPPTTP
ncbi:cellulose binding domain-containing protein, partial [Micromonospora sp. DH15]|nr:cellulose binding domain-containing protein [Micromonospora sp. DH15]